jgi:signal transduction histidine kinase
VNVFRRAFSPYVHARVWKESAHLLADLVVGIVLFTWVVTMISLGAGLAITLVGLPLLAIAIASGRVIAIVERARVRALLDVTLPAWPAMPPTTSTWQRIVRRFGDTAGWKGLAYGVVMLPWGIVTFTAAVTLWSLALSMAAFPLFGWWLPNDGDSFHPTGWAMVGVVLGTGVVGWLLVALLPRMIHGLASIDAAMARALLAPDEAAALQQRVVELEESRAAGTESAAHELRRIERDLHDGAQQRLVSVAMNLGMAKDQIDSVEDPKAYELVSRAHDEAKQAIVEMRELVRGIHPAILTDRGLDAAVSALAARCPVPVAVHSELPRRLPPAVESTAYFVVAEALTNLAKHSGAASGSVRMVDRGDSLAVEVHDDGRGGAVAGPGGGLHGLADRVRSVDGTLRIASPVGGPTVLLVELPCAS